MKIKDKYREWNTEYTSLKEQMFDMRTRHMSIEELVEYRECLKKMNKHARQSILFMIILTFALSVIMRIAIAIWGMKGDGALTFIMGWCLFMILMYCAMGDRNVRQISELIEKRLMEGRK